MVAAVQEEHSNDDGGPYEICAVGEQPSFRVNKALVNFSVYKQQPGNQVRFQVDTGSEYDLLPLKLHKSIISDVALTKLRTVQQIYRVLRWGTTAHSRKEEPSSLALGQKENSHG